MAQSLRVSEATVKSVNEVNSKGENRDCDSGCRGFKTRFSPHITKGLAAFFFRFLTIKKVYN